MSQGTEGDPAADRDRRSFDPARYASTPAPPAPPDLGIELIKHLTEGRPEQYYKQIDDARLALYAIRQRVRARSAIARRAALEEARRIRKLLEAAVERARDDERAQPGAFVPVRRPHRTGVTDPSEDTFEPSFGASIDSVDLTLR